VSKYFTTQLIHSASCAKYCQISKWPTFTESQNHLRHFLRLLLSQWG